MRLYQIGVGYAGVALEYHRVEAENRHAARSVAISKFLHPDKGYDYVVVKPVTDAEIAQEKRLKRLLEERKPPRM